VMECICEDGWIKGYGFFLGGDPRNYKPDRESCRPEEIAAWEEACARWNAGDETDEGASGKLVVAHGMAGIACGHRFGIGTFKFRCDNPDCPDRWKP